MSRNSSPQSRIYRAIVVEPDDELREHVTSTLFGHMTTIREAESSADALKMLDKEHFDIAYVHAGITDGSGRRLSKTVRAVFPETDVIVLSDKEDLDNVADDVEEVDDLEPRQSGFDMADPGLQHPLAFPGRVISGVFF
mgnify:CR=1 FL=1